MSFSEFELQLQLSDTTTLLNMLVSQLKSLDKPHNANDKMKIKAMFYYTFDALMHKLSLASDTEIDNFAQSLSSSTKAHNSIQEAVTKFYKKAYESLENAAHKYAKVVYDERLAIMHEAWKVDSEDSITDGAYYSLKTYCTEKDILDNKAPEIKNFFYETKAAAIQNNLKGNALHNFWVDLTGQKTLDKGADEDSIYNASDSDEILIGDKQTKGNNDTMQQPVGSDENWMQYRHKAISGLKALSSQRCAILFQENNPIGSFFMDVVNSVCESMGISPPFEQHKTQKFFKEVVEKIREKTGLEEGVLTNEDRNTPKPS